MRFCVPTAALCFSLVTFAAVCTTTSRAAIPAAPATASSPPLPQDSADAAAKHAKLTQCLKEAKDRKLVGPARTAFVKECTGKP